MKLSLVTPIPTIVSTNLLSYVGLTQISRFDGQANSDSKFEPPNFINLCGAYAYNIVNFNIPRYITDQ